MGQRIVNGIDKDKIVAAGRRPELWLAALLLWVLISASRSLGTPWAAAAGTEALRWGAGIALALALSRLGRWADAAGQICVVLTGAMALLGILGGADGAGTGLVGPYRDHQLYGSVLLLLLPFAAAYALSAKSGSWRGGALAVFAAAALCLMLSQTRSAWIGLAAAAIVFGWLWLTRPAARPRRWGVVLLPLALLLLGLVFAWLLSGPADQQAAVSHRAATLAALPEDQSWQTRLRVWRGAARMVAAHPALGVGLGRYPGCQWFWTHSGALLSPEARPSLSNEAHSFYGQTAAEIGLIGLALYLAVMAAFAARALRRLRAARHSAHLGRQNALLLAALSALVGQGVDALASPSWQFPEASFLFWAVLGLGLAALRRDTAPAALAPVPLHRFGRAALSGGLAVVLAAQLFPLGLLTPVEAYAAPSKWTLTSVTLILVSPASSVAGGSTIQFQTLANYTTQTGTIVRQDVTGDTASTSYNGFTSPTTKNYFPSAFTNGAVVLSSSYNYGSNIKFYVTVVYKDTGSGKTILSNQLSLAIQPTPQSN